MKKRILNTDEKLQNNSNEIITVKANSQLLHPLTCTWISTKIDKKDICLTKYNYQNNNFTFSKEQKCKDNNNYAKYLYLPPVGKIYTSLAFLRMKNEKLSELYDDIDIAIKRIKDRFKKN